MHPPNIYPILLKSFISNVTTSPSTFQTSENENIFPFIHILFRLNLTHRLHQNHQNSQPEDKNCSVKIPNKTQLIAIFFSSYIGYIEKQATINRPTHNQVKRVNSLVHAFFQTQYSVPSGPQPSLCIESCSYWN